MEGFVGGRGSERTTDTTTTTTSGMDERIDESEDDEGRLVEIYWENYSCDDSMVNRKNYAVSHNSSQSSSSRDRLCLDKCYEIMFDRFNDDEDGQLYDTKGRHRGNRDEDDGPSPASPMTDRDEDTDDDDDDDYLDGESADFLRAYCDKRNSYVFDIV